MGSATGVLAEWIYDPVCDNLSRYWYGKSSLGGGLQYGRQRKDQPPEVPWRCASNDQKFDGIQPVRPGHAQLMLSRAGSDVLD